MIHENPKISETFTTMFQTSKKQGRQSRQGGHLSDAYLQGGESWRRRQPSIAFADK